MKIRISLSTESLEKAKREIEEYKKSIQEKAKKVVSALIEYGFEICNAKILEMDIYDEGNLANSVSSYFDESTNKGFIKVNCEYAVFVEFGTGTKGANNSYIGEAMANVGYQYGEGENYVTLADGRIGWYYPKEDGTYRFTEGLPSRPFMYETAVEMRNNLNSIVKGVFK